MRYNRLIAVLTLIALVPIFTFAEKLANVAVLPFTGDKTVTSEQLTLITGKFIGDLLNTHNFQVLDRGKMEFILKEQGFQQQGACNSSECKVQIGQLLGVDNLISGTLVSFDSEYALHLEYVDVGTGQIQQTVELSEKGSLAEVYKNLSAKGAIQLASQITNPRAVPPDALPSMQKSSLSTKRKIALVLGGLSLAGAGTGVYFNSQYNDANSQFDNAQTNHNAGDLKQAESDMSSYKQSRTIAYGASLGTAVIALILWFLPEGN